MNGKQITKAFFELCKEENKIDLIAKQFDDLKLLIENNPTWILLLDSPMLPFDTKVKMIDELKFDQLLLSFLKMLMEKRIFYLFQTIYREWLHLNREYQKIAYIQVISAKKLNSVQQEKLVEALRPRFKGKEIVLNISIDKNIIGGIVTIYKGQSLDQSIARDLEELFIAI